MSFNFADTYRAASLMPGPDILSRRRKTFDKLRKEYSPKAGIDLSRLYFGLPLPKGSDWFRAAFAKNDPSFSMLDNEREASVLATCLLAAAIDDGEASAGLALLVTAAAGNRQPLVQPTLIDDARQALDRRAITLRQTRMGEVARITPLAKSRTSVTIATVFQGSDYPEWSKFGELVKQNFAETEFSLRSIGQLDESFGSLAAEVVRLREEVDMLWWYVGGWSRLFDKPFSDFSDAPAAVLVGLDLADLVKGAIGPISAPAIMHRLLSAGRTERKVTVTLEEAVDSFPSGARANFDFGGEELRHVQDICPVLAALLKASEIGNSPAWHEPFRTVAHFNPQATFQPLELAMQVYREKLLLKQLRMRDK